MPKLNLTGQQYGLLTVIEEVQKNGKDIMWRCKCWCGQEKIVSTKNLRRGHTKSCGCLHANNLINKTFNRLTVIDRADNTKDGKTQWKCRCECGNNVIVLGSNLIKGYTKSCGCLSKQKKSERKLRNIVGQTFGLLTALQRADNDEKGNVQWL